MHQMPSDNIICLGSLIMDISVHCDRLPTSGETVYTHEDYHVSPGGKGGNQAVAAARAGGNVTLIGKVANDDYAHQLIANFQKDQIDTSRLIIDKSAKTGVAFVWVDQKGHNSCLCSLGVNSKFTVEELRTCSALFKKGTIIMTTLEHSSELLEEISLLSEQKQCILIVDPSSKDYSKLTKTIAKRIDILKPNEIEAEMLTGIQIKKREDAVKAIHLLQNMGIRNPVISLGSKGVIYEYDNKITVIDAVKVKAVDTTAAGDTFIGSMAAKLSTGHSFENAVEYANKAASYCVQHYGAQISIPFEENVL